MIPLKETFLSIQGEGYYAGESAFFIRTQGCDIGCHWCDEPNSWPMSKDKQTTSLQIISYLEKINTKIIIFTGGEPLMHNLTDVSKILTQKGYHLHLETSGSYPLTGDWDWITLSPKKIKPPLPEIYQNSSELKIVIYNHSDFEWALEQEKKVNKACLLYLQPEWSKMHIMQPHIIDFISNNPRWKLSLQMHKYLNIQ